MVPRTGTILGRYQIKAEIGRGSMGVVYRARDPRINRTVAIKTVSLAGLEAGVEHEYRERFVVEAQAAGRLSHPGIVTVFDVAEDPETRTPYLVMEHIEGQSLDQLLDGENKRLPLSTSLRLTQELAEALHYAHTQGVIHRDIKPANILLSADGRAKIADFGIAKLNQTHMTVHGQVLGSPAYMAPEQLTDEAVDARADLFSLGVVLYYMLTGQKPFQGNSIATVCFKLANYEPLAVATYDMNFPPQLDLIVSRALAKNPAQRYQSGGEMARDIQRLREKCGLVEIADLDKYAVPRPSAEPGADSSVSRSKSTVHPMSGSGIRVATQALRSVALTRIRNVALVLVISAALFVVFYRANRPAPSPPRVGSTPNPTAGVSANWSDNPAPLPPANAKLRLEIEHPFTEARASIWLDNQLVLTQSLHADEKNRMLVFKKTRGHDSHNFDLRSGKHQVKVRVQSTVEAYDQSRTVAINFAPKGERTLSVNCDKKHNLLQVMLR